MKLIIFVVIISLLVGLGYHKFNELTRPMPLPTLDTNKYWGPGNGASYKPTKSIEPFKLQINAEEISNLHAQLNRTLKLTEPLEGINFEYGFNTDALAQLVKYWRDDYLPRWTEREAFLNKFPQYTTDIQGLRIHYIHSKPTAEQSKGKKVLPLLLLHGWPGSVREFYDFIPILNEPSSMSDYVFEVIAPSLVGYGWSQASPKKGFHAAHMATVMRNLMLRVGFERFMVQGGDWGAIIGSDLTTLFPENVIGFHSNMCIMKTPLSIMKGIYAEFFPEKYVPSRFFYEHHFPLKEKLKFLIRESGYFHLQATKPDTIGAALSQNPIGLAAYILEKFQMTTGPGLDQRFNALATVFTLDALLDNVMIYYLSNTATSAGRFYAENMSKEYQALHMDRVPSPVPMACARFKHDLPAAMDWQLLDKFPNLLNSMYFNQGGHFAALELPVMLYINFAEFVAKIKFE